MQKKKIKKMHMNSLCQHSYIYPVIFSLFFADFDGNFRNSFQ